MNDASNGLMFVLDQAISMHRARLGKDLKRLGDGGVNTFDQRAQQLVDIAQKFQRRREEIAASKLLTQVGKDNALIAAAQDAERALRELENDKLSKGMQARLDVERRTIFAPPPQDDGASLITRADLRTALQQQWITQAIYSQLVALDLLQRETLARTSVDRDVLQVLMSGPPTVRASAQPYAKGQLVEVQPLIRPEVRTDIQKQRARVEHPEETERLDELLMLQESMGAVIALTRERVGLEVRTDLHTVTFAASGAGGAEILRSAVDGPNASIKTVDAALTR